MTDIATNVKSGAARKAPPITASPTISSDIPQSENLTFEFPVLFRGLSDKNAEHAKQNWQTMKSATDKMTAEVQGACSSAARESMEYGMKVMEIARANTSAALELAN